MIGHNSYALEKDSIYYLIVYKTTNGGTTWTGPTNIGMSGAKPLLPKASASTKFITGFEMDNIVDANGNLHVIIPISPEITTQGWAMSSQAGMWGMFDVYTTDGGTAWRAKLLGTPNTLAGTYGVSASDATNPTLTIYNRGQISKSWDGKKLFFSYFDTNDTINFGATNMNPNAFITGYDAINDKWTNQISTVGTIAESVIIFGCASHYVLGMSGTYNFPLVYQELTGDATKTGSPVLFHYLNGLSMNDADFTLAGNSVPLSLLLGTNEIKENHGLSVSQNYPNPFNNNTSFTLTLAKNANVNIDVFNTIGQKVIAIENKTYNAGTHTVTIDGSNLNAGVYFYSVRTGESTITQRMLVK
jgi:hypothetical protein